MNVREKNPLNLDQTFIKGFVISGRGKASQMVTDYDQELERLTGTRLYAGSLNLFIKEPCKLSWKKGSVLSGEKKIVWPAKIGEEQVWLYRVKNMPYHIFEVLSHNHLRTRFGLADGNSVVITIDSNLIEPLSFWKQFWWRRIWAGREQLYYKDDAYVKRANKALKRLGAK